VIEHASVACSKAGANCHIIVPFLVGADMHTSSWWWGFPTCHVIWL